MDRDRKLLAQLIKSWAQDHNHAYQIANFEHTDNAMATTGAHLAYLIQKEESSLDLLELLDRLDVFLELRKKPKIDGMFCKKCQSYVHYGEPNQEDGSLVCYVCRCNPYR